MQDGNSKKDVAECRKEICKVLGVNNRNSHILQEQEH